MRNSTEKKMLLILVLYTSLNVFSQNKPPCNYYPDLNEHIIHDNYFKDHEGALLEQTSFYNDIQYTASGCSPTCQLDRDPVIIKLTAVIDFFNKTKTLSANIRGLEITFGLNGDHMVYFYTPVTMTYSPTEHVYKVTKIPAGVPQTYYTYSRGSDSFTPVSPEDVEKVVDARKKEYENNIRIRHLPLASHEKINLSNTWEHDTQSVIFSFQEIFALSQACFNCTETESIYLYNGAWGYIIDPNNRSNIRNKHNIFIACSPLDTPTNVLNANMAHLCPPSCDPAYDTTENRTQILSEQFKSQKK